MILRKLQAKKTCRQKVVSLSTKSKIVNRKDMKSKIRVEDSVSMEEKGSHKEWYKCQLEKQWFVES